MSQWKRYIDDIFSLWTTERKEIDEFIALANRHHPSIKFTAEISDKEINFLDTTVYKGERFHNQGILDIRTHFKPTETFQYTHFSSCNPHGVRKGLIKGEALRILRTNSSAKSFYENICNFKKRLRARGGIVYPHVILLIRFSGPNLNIHCFQLPILLHSEVFTRSLTAALQLRNCIHLPNLSNFSSHCCVP